MKSAYSTYSTKGWKVFKLLYPGKTEGEYCRFAAMTWLAACARSQHKCNGNMSWDRDSVYVDNALEFLWKFRRVTHYFLAPGVAEFCVSSVKEFSVDYCKRLPFCAPVMAPPNRCGFRYCAPVDICPPGTIQGGFAVHFPVKERQRSVMVIPDAFIPAPYKPSANTNDGDDYIALHYYFIANDGEDTLLMQPTADFICGNEGAKWIAGLVFGLSLYMDAFPDVVVEAGTESIHQINHYDGARRVICRNEIVDEEHLHSVSPHWRRGHFRLLSSERFVHKKGQTVYVRGTFVKGMAYDVLDDDPASSAVSVGAQIC